MYRFKPSHRMRTLKKPNRRSSFRVTRSLNQFDAPQRTQTNHRPHITSAAKRVLAELKMIRVERDARSALTEEQKAAIKERMRSRGETDAEKAKRIQIEKECRKGNLDLSGPIYGLGPRIEKETKDGEKKNEEQQKHPSRFGVASSLITKQRMEGGKKVHRYNLRSTAKKEPKLANETRQDVAIRNVWSQYFWDRLGVLIRTVRRRVHLE